jgi:DNA-binding transcriptional LysR family regulator
VAVADELSFTKAADKLHLAQPSLARQVRNLEEELGIELFDRSNNRIQLTVEGSVFLASSRKVLTLCAEGVAAVQRMKQRDGNQLNIAYVANLHHGFLPATLEAFRKLFPDVELNLFDMTCTEQFQALRDRKIDIGFTGLPSAPSNSDLLFECATQDEILIALPTAHPFAKRARLTLTELSTQFFIGMSPKTHPALREWLRELCRGAGFAARILQEADGEPTAIKLVADGLGVAFLPKQVFALAHDGVVFLPLTPTLRRESAIAWLAASPSIPLKNYVQVLKDHSQCE